MLQAFESPRVLINADKCTNTGMHKSRLPGRHGDNFCMVVSNTKYMIMSRDHNAGRSHSMKNDNSSIERVEEFKYLGTTLLFFIIGIQPLGRSGQRPEFSQVTGMALVRCILGKFLGVLCHCFPPEQR